MSVFSLYRGLTFLIGPLVQAHLKGRIAKGKEDPVRIDERMGLAQTPRPKGKLVWVHAASIGEAMSSLTLIHVLKHVKV